MLDGAVALQVLSLASIRALGKSMPRGTDILSGAMPNYSVYECADGKFIGVGAIEPKFFHTALRAAGRPDLVGMPLVPGSSPLRDELGILFKTRTRDEWEASLAELDTCVTAVLTPEEALHNEQVRARELIETVAGKPAFRLPIRFDNTVRPGGESPRLGADNEAILGTTPPRQPHPM
jgi:crotonobetainyl-CoA:carnitine CoA-transferase CaiB-like acyl-CoA transferase